MLQSSEIFQGAEKGEEMKNEEAKEAKVYEEGRCIGFAEAKEIAERITEEAIPFLIETICHQCPIPGATLSYQLTHQGDFCSPEKEKVRCGVAAMIVNLRESE